MEGELGGVRPVKISVCPLEFLWLVFLLCCAALKRRALTSPWREVAPDWSRPSQTASTGHPQRLPSLQAQTAESGPDPPTVAVRSL